MKKDVVENIDALVGIAALPDHSIDLIIADPPYGLGKDYGNDSDKKPAKEFLNWMEKWLLLVLPKLKKTGSLYIFATWRYSPEIFVFLKQHMIMLNEIIWDRKVPSMGGTTRKYSSVHDTIGFFAKTPKYYFDLDPIRIPYDAETKKARSRSIFVGKKWLEVGYNPKMFGRSRACIGFIRSVRIILPKSRLRSLSAWLSPVARKAALFLILSRVLERRWRRASETSDIISPLKSTRHTSTSSTSELTRPRLTVHLC